MTNRGDTDSKSSGVEISETKEAILKSQEKSLCSDDEPSESQSRSPFARSSYPATDLVKEQDEQVDNGKTETWPVPLSDDNIESHVIPTLPNNNDEVRAVVERSQKLLIRVITWNQEAKSPPSSDNLRKYLIPKERYHIIAIGTQECENSIAKSVFYPSKAKWEKIIFEAVGTQYQKVCDHILQATYL